MAQQIVIKDIDDIDGTEAAEKIRFALDGTDYEIDLSVEHAAEMREELAGYIAKARRLPRNGRGKRAARRSRDDLPSIREYARSRGYEINERGRVPQRIVDEYDKLGIGAQAASA